MSHISRYLLRTLILSLLFVTLAVTAAVWLAQSLRYVDVVVENGAPLHMFIWLALLTLPTFLALTLPIALFVAVLFTYHRLAMDSELVVMRATGLSPRALAGPAVLLALGITLLGWFLSLWVQPIASRELIGLQYFIQSQFSAALLREGVFNNVDDDFTVYVQSREGDGELKGLLIHDGRNKDAPVTIRAGRGRLIQSGNGPQVIVYEGLQQEFNRKTHRMSELFFDSYTVGLESVIKPENARTASPRERDTLEILQLLTTETSPILRAKLKAELNQRFAGPPLALAFTLIAACCLLFGEFNRRGQTKRILIAVALATVVQALVLSLGQTVGKNAWALAPLYLAALLPIILGGGLLWHSGLGEKESAA